MIKCPKLDTCPKVQSLFSRDRAFDEDLADKILQAILKGMEE